VFRWERSYWVLRDHILHGYVSDDLKVVVAHMPLDRSEVIHSNHID